MRKLFSILISASLILSAGCKIHDDRKAVVVKNDSTSEAAERATGQDWIIQANLCNEGDKVACKLADSVRN